MNVVEYQQKIILRLKENFGHLIMGIGFRESPSLPV